MQAQYRRVAGAEALVQSHERCRAMIGEMVLTREFGLGQADLDGATAAILDARRDLDVAIGSYRDRLDAFKVALGLAPGAPVILDRSSLAVFGAVFGEITNRTARPDPHRLDLDFVLRELPPIGDCPIDGRPILAEVEQAPDRLESVLTLATQAALAHRPPGGESADALELRVRQRVRRLLVMRAAYASEQRALILAIRRADAASEQVLVPPLGGAAPRATGPPTSTVLERSREVYDHRTRLVTAWTLFQAEHLALDRDLGPLRDADWPAFLGRFTARNEAVPIPVATDPARPVGPILIPINPRTPPPPR